MTLAATSHHLRAAQGWLELGNWQEANEELEKIIPELRAHPAVLLLRCAAYARAKKWDYVLTVAETLVKIAPKEGQGWIQRSFALHEMKRTQEAFDLLLPAAKKFPKLWLVPYNLACYCTQLGRLDECQEWFKKAMTIDEHSVKGVALDDPDLKPLWDSLSGTTWKRAL